MGDLAKDILDCEGRSDGHGGIELPVNLVFVNDRHRKDLGDLGALAESIRSVGLLQPVVIRRDGTVIAGERRLAAVKQLGWERVSVRVARDLETALDYLRAERDENICRKELLPTEIASLAAALEPLEREDAQRRQEASRAKPGERADERASTTDARSAGGRTDKRVASALGVGKTTLRKIMEVTAKAKDDPEHFGDLPGEMDKAPRKVAAVHRQMMERETPPVPIPEEATPEEQAAVAALQDAVEKLRRLAETAGVARTTSKAIKETRATLGHILAPRLRAGRKQGDLDKGSQAYRLARFLFDAIRAWKPDFAEPKFQGWAKDADLMLRVDGRGFGRVCAVISWIHNGETDESGFWKGNVLSVAKLRKQYDQVDGKMKLEAEREKRKAERRENGEGGPRRPDDFEEERRRQAARRAAGGAKP